MPTILSTQRRRRPAAKSRALRQLVAAFLSVLLVSVAVACSSDESSESSTTNTSPSDSNAAASGDALAPQPLAEKTKLTVGWPGPYEVWASVIVADGMGELEKENIEVEFTTIDASGAIAMLEQGKLDVFVSSIGANVFNALAGGASIRWAAPAFLPHPDSEEGIWVNADYVKADGSIDVDKFKGTSLGLGTGGLAASASAVVVPWLEGLGLSPKDFQYETFTGPDILVGIENGSISAGWLSDPYWVSAKSEGVAKFAVGFNPDQSLSGYILSGDLLHDRSDVGRAFLRALARTNRDHLAGDYHSNEKVVQVLADAIGVEPATIAEATGCRFTDDLEFDHDVVEVLQSIWIDVGGILDYKTPLKPDQVIDTSLNP